MLDALSEQERFAVARMDKLVQQGDIDTTPIWADSFTSTIFVGNFAGEVVDVGCGTGRFVEVLPDLGITRYVGIDPSNEAIRYCTQQFPEHMFEVGEIRELGERYPNRFSGFILTTTLMHIPRKDVRRALMSLRHSLRTGAPGLISLPKGEPDRLTVVNKYGMHLTLYTERELNRILPLAGFSIVTMFSPHGSHMLLAHVVAV